MDKQSPVDETIPCLIQIVRVEGDVALAERWSWVVGDASAARAVACLVEGVAPTAYGSAPTAIDALEAAIEHLMGFEFPGGPTLQHTKMQRFRAVMAHRHQLVRRLQRREDAILSEGAGVMEECPECEGRKTDSDGKKCRYCSGKGKIRRKPAREMLRALSTATRTQLVALDGDAKMLGVERPPPESDGGVQADEFAQWQQRPAAKAGGKTGEADDPDSD